MKIFNPANDQLLQEINEDTISTLDEKYQVLRQGVKEFSQTSLSERIAKISRFADLLRAEEDQLATLLTSETGKPLIESRNEILAAADKVQFFIQESENILHKRKVQQIGNTEESISYEPLGVIANISAWNYPYLVGVNIFIPALVCGNAVLYKPSEFATLSGLEIQRLIKAAGLSENVFQICLGGPLVGEAILALPLDGYFFTGSYKTGRHIATAVAPKLVPVGLELGGKDPLYVTDEVTDIAAVAAAAVSGAFYNNGQSCCAVERIYVHEKVYPEFLEKFLHEVDQLVVGNPLLASTTNGAITRAAQLNFLSAQVTDALAKGGTLARGGKVLPGPGNYFTPTVIVDANEKMQLMTEESFGPIIGIQTVKNDDEALTYMNNTQFGLTAAVYCSDHMRGEKIIGQLDCGTGYLNCCDRVSAYTPWSGRKNSGLGSTLSAHGLYAFCNPKAWQIRTT